MVICVFLFWDSPIDWTNQWFTRSWAYTLNALKWRITKTDVREQTRLTLPLIVPNLTYKSPVYGSFVECFSWTPFNLLNILKPFWTWVYQLLVSKWTVFDSSPLNGVGYKRPFHFSFFVHLPEVWTDKSTSLNYQTADSSRPPCHLIFGIM
jgi:hypothetical protein